MQFGGMCNGVWSNEKYWAEDKADQESHEKINRFRARLEEISIELSQWDALRAELESERRAIELALERALLK